jgi:hypothetical protein
MHAVIAQVAMAYGWAFITIAPVVALARGYVALRDWRLGNA